MEEAAREAALCCVSLSLAPLNQDIFLIQRGAGLGHRPPAPAHSGRSALRSTVKSLLNLLSTEDCLQLSLLPEQQLNGEAVMFLFCSESLGKKKKKKKQPEGYTFPGRNLPGPGHSCKHRSTALHYSLFPLLDPANAYLRHCCIQMSGFFFKFTTGEG